MSRDYVADITREEREHLDGLLDSTSEPHRYRDFMCLLGHDLGARVRRHLDTPELVVVCTVEDADFLARGMIDELADELPVHLVCFWNERSMLGTNKIAPVIQRYAEPFDADRVEQIVVLKSIISTGCVVKTNLVELLAMTRPEGIFVAAPVIHRDSISSLEAEFPEHVSDLFDYIYLARDDHKEGSIIRPGIGGSVYELLGLGDMHTKNLIQPEIVRHREDTLWSARAR